MRRRLGLSTAGVACLLIAGCNGGTHGSGAHSSGTRSPTTAPGRPGVAATAPTVGGPRISNVPAQPVPANQVADPARPPWKVGLLNDNQGAGSYPGVDAGAFTAAKWLNATRGGIGGHPIQVVTCTAGADARSEKACAQQFAADPTIAVVTSGFLFSGAGAYSVLAAAGKSVLGGEPLAAADLAAPNVYFYRAGTAGVITGISDFAINVLHAKAGTLITSGGNAGQAVLAAAQGPWTAAGLPLRTVGLPANGGDVTASLRAASATRPAAIMAVVAGPGCDQVAKAVASLGGTGPVVTTDRCAVDGVVGSVGSQMQGWYFVLDSASNDAASNDPRTDVDPDVQTVRDAWKTYGAADVSQPATVMGFADMVVIAGIANRLGSEDATARSLGAAMAAFSGPVFAGPTSVRCPGPTLPSVCATQYTVEQLRGTELALVAGGRFFTPGG